VHDVHAVLQDGSSLAACSPWNWRIGVHREHVIFVPSDFPSDCLAIEPAGIYALRAVTSQ
jgi:hypothetical protein